MTKFLLGVMFGGTIGTIIAALCYAAGDTDERWGWK